LSPISADPLPSPYGRNNRSLTASHVAVGIEDLGQLGTGLPSMSVACAVMAREAPVMRGMVMPVAACSQLSSHQLSACAVPHDLTVGHGMAEADRAPGEMHGPMGGMAAPRRRVTRPGMMTHCAMVTCLGAMVTGGAVVVVKARPRRRNERRKIGRRLG